SVKLNNQPANKAGHNNGKIMREKMTKSVAPKSFAASKIFLSKLIKRLYVVTTTNGIQKLIWARSKLTKPSFKCKKVNKIKRAAPITISGDKIKIKMSPLIILFPKKR